MDSRGAGRRAESGSPAAGFGHGPLDDARQIADAEDRIADAEREIADAEDTIADLQDGDDGKQEETPVPDDERVGVNRWRAEREASRTRGAQRTAERSDHETLHTEVALDRFEVAEERDKAAGSRDRASDARDVAAATRDRRPPPQALAPAVVARRRAAEDRGHSAGDRAHSGNDRKETQDDRQALRDALTEAHMDALTGTYQRAMGLIALQGELDRAARSDTPLTLAFVDVDDLKVCNDRDGHAAGDSLLQDVAASVTANLRSYDPVVRYGGDEFICALADADLTAACARFRDISATLHARNAGASISVGYAVLKPADTLDDLIARGDADLYKAKRRRKTAR